MKTLRIILSLLFLCLSAEITQAQTRPGSLKGTVTEASTGDSIPYANVIVMDETGNIIKQGVTGFDGRYNLKPIPPGAYRVEYSFIGFAKVIQRGVIISSNTPTVLNVKLREETSALEEVVITYERPLIDVTKSSMVIAHEDMANMAVRDVTSVSSQAASVTSKHHIRGGRSGETVYFIDGVKVHGNVNHHYPAPTRNTDNESYATIEELPFKNVSSAPLSTFSSDVDAASYANVRRFITEGQLPPADAVRIEEMINYFDYSYPDPEEGEVFSMTTELGNCPWKEGHQLLKIGIKTREVPRENLPDNNLVFLIDVSGSMNSQDKLPLLQKSLRLLVGNLNEKDRVAIVVYASATGLVLESTKGTNKQKILDAIDKLQAGGSTAGGAGIQLAYKVAAENFKEGENNRVILATDGDFNVGITRESDLVKLIEKEREAGIFLTVLGFGTGNLQDSKMEKLADHGNGNYAYIDNLMEAQKVLVNEMGATLNTVAKDTKFQIEFNPLQVKSYRLIGYENRVLNDEDFNNDTKDAGDVGSGHSVTAVYEIIPAGSGEEPGRPPVDPLRYQQRTTLEDPSVAEEFATLKIRYKTPDAEESILRTHIIPAMAEDFKPSEDFRFVCAILETGMLLRQSEYAGNSSYEEATKLARAGKGEDVNGYRGEFIRLISLAGKLDRSKNIGMR